MPSPIAEAVGAALTKFPNAGSKTVAERLFADFPEMFPSVESARNAVRYYRGNKGRRNRKALARRQHARAPRKPGASFPSLPEGITCIDDFAAVQVSGPAKVLVLADLHVPYHSHSALKLAVVEGKGADVVLLNGDYLDFYELSRYETDPRKCNFKLAIAKGQDTLRWLRGKFPNARIILKKGNHDERYESYLATRAPAVLGIAEFEYEHLLHCSEVGVEVVGEKRPIRLGKLNVLHGHEYRTPMQNPVNPARGLFLRAKTHAMCSHFHQSSNHCEKNLESLVVSTWSTGCLCDLHPLYMPLNNWNHGAAVVDVFADDHFHVRNFKIINGKVY